MSEWKEFILEDVIEKFIDYRGKTPKKTSFGIPLMTAKIIKGGRLLEPTEYIAKEDYLDWMTRGFPEINDILLTTEAPLGEVALVKDKNVALGQRIITLQTKKGLCDSIFLKYYLQSFEGQASLQSRASGSTVEGIKSAELKKIEISLPPLNEQKAIASILSSLDDKIDLLNRQNATLEKMAETLFRQWFVERRPEPVEGEAKEEWKEIKLGRIVDIINGVSYNSDDLNPSKTAMVTLKNFDRNGGFRMDGFKEYIGKYKEQHILKEGDLVVAQTDITQEAGVIGNPVMVIGNPKYDTLVFSMDLVKVISKDENYSNEFLYLLMKSRAFKEHCLGYSNGSTVLHLSKKAIPEYEMKLPSKNFIKDFSIKIKPLVQKQYRNQTQIRTLAALRDTLLPKLMSGEIRVL